MTIAGDFCKKNVIISRDIFTLNFFLLYLIQSEVICLTVNRLKRIRVRCRQRIRN